MQYKQKVWSGAFGAILNQNQREGLPAGDIYDNKITPTGGNQADEFARARYLIGLRSGAPTQWMSDHLREDQRLRGVCYIAIKVLADQAACAEVNFHKWERHAKLGSDQDSKVALNRNHPLCKLLHRPNPQDSRGMILRRLVQQLLLTGTSLLWRVDDGLNVPRELWSIPTGTYQPVPISWDYPDGAYRVMPWFPGPLAMLPGAWNQGGIVIDSKHIMVTRMPHPLVQTEGLSPLAACDLPLDCIESIDQARFNMMRRGAFPSAIVEMDPTSVLPNEPEMQRLQGSLADLLGSPNRAGRVAMLSPGLKLNLTDAGNFETGWIKSWDQLVSFVLSVFGVTKSLAFMSEDTSFAALYASLKQFNLLTLTPLLQQIADSFNHNLVHPFFGEDLFITLTPKKIDNDELVESQIANDLKAGIRTVREIRNLRNLEEVEWGDERAYAGQKPEEQQPNDFGDAFNAPAPTEDPLLHDQREDDAGTLGSLGGRLSLNGDLKHLFN